MIKALKGLGLLQRVALGLLLLIGLIAVIGPSIAPHPYDKTVGPPFVGPSGHHLLGTDVIGRDVLSRILAGGRSVVLFAAGATLATTVIGCTLGMLAGLKGGWVDEAIMRPLDIAISVPPLLLVLILVAVLARSPITIAIVVAVAGAPILARIVRSVSQQVAKTGYVEAARARGEGTAYIVFREVLPNVMNTVLADAGVRFVAAIYLIASASFLGVGAQPPSSDWPVMIAENRQGVDIQPWSVVAPALMIVTFAVCVGILAQHLQRRAGSPIVEATAR
jgi:ABC-type dipeptide/oligopeptide/nickel transport system permease subunit